MAKDKELTYKTPSDLVAPEGGWGDGEFEAKDLLVPMICVAQAMSDVTKLGKARPGEIYETVNKTILGDAKKALKFIPVKYFKTWVHCEVVGGRPQFRSIEAYTIENSSKYPYDESRLDGTAWRNYEVLNFYVLLEDELKAGAAFPYLLSFRSSNKKKGRPLINHMARMRAMNPPAPLCSMTFSMTSVIATKGQDSWFVFDLSQSEKTSNEYMTKALEWLKTLKTMTSVKIDEAGLKEEVSGVEEEREEINVKKGEVSKEARY